MDIDAGSAMTAGVLVNDGFALRTDFKGVDFEVGEQ